MKLNKPIKREWSDLKHYTNNWIAEPKFDGERATLSKIDGKINVIRENGNNKNIQYPELLNIPIPNNTILDGEVCIPTSDYTSDFNTFQLRMNLRDEFRIKQYLKNKATTVSFVAFDVIRYKDKSMENFVWNERRALLDRIVDSDRLRKVKYFNPTQLQGLVKRHEVRGKNSMEGIVLKQTTGLLTSNWYKIKNLVENDFKVVGYNTSEKRSVISTITVEDEVGNQTNVTYYTNMPVSDEILNNLKGSTAVVQYLPSGSKDKLRFPVLKEVRVEKCLK